MKKTIVMVLKIQKERPVLKTKCYSERMSRTGFSSVTLTNMNLCSIGSSLYLKVPNQVSLGGKHKFICFYPKIMAYCIGLDACRFLKNGILLHVRVTHEDKWRQMLKNETNF